MSTSLTRRALLAQVQQVALLAGAAGLINSVPAEEPRRTMTIQTVLGLIPVADFGFALPHEHIQCDFIGAEQTHRGRWDVDEVTAAILPNLLQLKERGVTGFVDCTPAYIGRDPRVLRQLSQQSGMHIVTNTGYYGGMNDKFVPSHAHEESAEQLAAHWISEWKNGIEDTGVKPGFIKIGIDEIPETAQQLSPLDAKLVRAAAQSSRATGLSVTCHTGGAQAAYVATQLFIEEKGNASRFVVAHSDGHGHAINRKIAELGSWVSFDGIGYRPLEEHLKIVLPMLEEHADQLLLSMDRGWWWVGEPNGGKIQDYNYLCDTFLPALRKAGVSQTTIQQLTVKNPARAFAQ
ncbi:MAG: 5-phospho-D-xylono,4-lactonase [Abditibacteriota bacterium]|nr:5-phospho-D-xylono,4-lactonase [Abditibacteriota bacterium]